MLYASPRCFGDLAEGLIHGCVGHFKEPIRISRNDLPSVDGEQRVRFRLVRAHARKAVSVAVTRVVGYRAVCQRSKAVVDSNHQQ